MFLPAHEAAWRWFLGLLLGLLAAGVPDLSDGQGQPPVPPNINIGALFDAENEQPAIEAAFNHACRMVNDDRSTLIRSTLTCTPHQITPADSFKASKISKGSETCNLQYYCTYTQPCACLLAEPCK